MIRDNNDKRWEIHYNGYYSDDKPIIHFRSGDTYKLWVEVDGSFEPSFYDVKWRVKKSFNEVIEEGKGLTIKLELDYTHASYSPTIEIWLVTKRKWHRGGTIDDLVTIDYSDVLPPIEDTF